MVARHLYVGGTVLVADVHMIAPAGNKLCCLFLFLGGNIAHSAHDKHMSQVGF